MTAEDILNKTKKMDTPAKVAYLERVISAIGDVEGTLLKKSDEAKNIVQQSKNVGDEIIKIITEHIHKLKTENISLHNENNKLRNDTSAIDELKNKIYIVNNELDQMKSAYAKVLKEKQESEQKLLQFQEQWDNFMKGV
ncbi:MAG: hypothetical protein HQK94_09180 [Nitrospirae bacterium]|nr:hypothetical protein [Nitrospirota bacterium]